MKKKISVIIPAKEEAETIEKVLRELNAVLKRISKKYKSEVIVVCDSRRDKTLEVARKLGARILIPSDSGGKGAALSAGIKHSNAEIIVTMDADFSHRAKDLPYLLTEFERGRGFVIGSRIVGGTEENEFLKMAGNVFLTLIFGLMFGKFVSDTLNGFKVFKKEIIKERLTSRGFEVEIEILAKAIRYGDSISEVSSHERARAGGVAKSRIFIHGPIIFWKVFIEGLKFRLSRKSARNN